MYKEKGRFPYKYTFGKASFTSMTHVCETLKEIFDPHLKVVGIFGRTQFKRPSFP